MTNIDFMGKRKYFYVLSILVMVIGLISYIIQGFNYDIDFTGGTVLEINLHKVPSAAEITDLEKLTKQITGTQTPIVRKIEDGKKIMINAHEVHGKKRTELSKETRDKLFNAIAKKYNLKKEDLISYQNVGAVVSSELKSQAVWAVIIASILMLIYIAIRFEFKFGTTAVIALLHDLLIMLTVYTLFKIPLNSTFIAAMLTVLGYSINDTIVVFDRIRENRRIQGKMDLKDLVNLSMNQTIGRSLSTAATVIIVLFVLYLMGVQSIKEFALPLLIGITSGTYSSIFIATALWFDWERSTRKKLQTKPKRA
ncbi:protein translocase subunit SecF [Caldicellulosiruptor changbaiensis]|uniref:Protein-export membrane protein SecF n=1 Tax=Caldicellulosiruptor changbaiensis TaxID=1222016 RepID=A0A3T0D3D2_9FIRM|nr:protein translocase subunit SecF [Caldicellulosiruptor changbaiensis]AZT89688.1 protein translocase subunit SecF [Caldicellulosiruptor changbaiensis]